MFLSAATVFGAATFRPVTSVSVEIDPVISGCSDCATEIDGLCDSLNFLFFFLPMVSLNVS